MFIISQLSKHWFHFWLLLSFIQISTYTKINCQIILYFSRVGQTNDDIMFSCLEPSRIQTHCKPYQDEHIVHEHIVHTYQDELTLSLCIYNVV